MRLEVAKASCAKTRPADVLAYECDRPRREYRLHVLLCREGHAVNVKPSGGCACGTA